MFQHFLDVINQYADTIFFEYVDEKVLICVCMFCFFVFIKAFWRLMILFHILVGRICEIIILCGIDKKDRYIRQAHFIHTYFSLSTQWEYFFSIKRKTLEKCTFWDRLIHHHHCWDLPLCDKNQKMFVSLSDASTKTSTSTEFVFCIYQHILFSYVRAERTNSTPCKLKNICQKCSSM